MTAIPTAAFRLTANGSQAVNELRKTKGAVDQIGPSVRRLSSVLGSFGVAISGLALASFIRSSAQAADELGKAADRVGVTTDRLRAFRLAAEEAGVATSMLDKSLIEAQLRLGQAAAGTGEARKYLELLKLDTAELVRLRPDELFLRYADAIGGLRDESAQLAATNALFGESGRQLIELIRGGRPVIDEAQQAVTRLGLALNRVDTKQIEQANDSLGRLQAVTSAVGQNITAALAPLVSAFVDSLLQSGLSVDDLRAKFDKMVAVGYFGFQTLRNGAKSLEAAFFDVAASGARVLQALTFGDLSQSFATSVQVNSDLAKAALNEVRSFAQISDQYIALLESNRARAEASVAAQQAAVASRQAGGVALGTPAGSNVFSDSEVDAIIKAETEKARAREETWAQFDAEFISRRKEAQVLAGQQQLEAVIASEQAIHAARAQTANLAVGLLQAVAGRSKAAAVAAIVLGKGLAIAQTIQSTSAAVMRAYAELGPIAGSAAAAKIALLGKVQVGLIAATGLGQIASLGSGGASIGTPANPVFTQNNGDQPQAGASGQNVLQVVFAGPVFNTADTRRFIAEAIREETDRDVIIINQRSAQAQALQGA